MTTDVDAVEVAADGTTYRLVLPDRESDYIQGWVSEHGRPYEHPMLADMARRLHAGDVVLDVGANVGNHSIYLAAVVGCHVEAFEPDATLTSALGASVEANGLGAVVRVHTVALGSGAGTGALVRPDVTNIGAQQIRLGEGDIRVVPLDAVDVRRPVRGMKVDVEGMELAVLQGAAVLIEQDRPLLYVECATEIAFGAVASWLDERGYSYWETFNATPTHLFVPTETLTADQVSRRLLLKTVRDGYRSTEAFNGLRGRLEQANLKYRASTEAHRVLKHELDEVRSEQARAEESAAAELSHAQGERERLESERAGLERHAHELLAAVEALQSDLDRMRIELADARQTAAFAEGERDAARGRAAEAHRDRDDLAVELRALREEADRLRVEVAARTEDLGVRVPASGSGTPSCRRHSATPRR
ncbi:FkbM family methyltransferase [Cellulomonas sp. ATA003]|uniref:FkbM family methyltransferase n=1 Tax=Cellulomonas sp. ATA003 TaxID=3073064 RepID=UPI002872E136|nr:FkbM family methyltransferase [Cellulomonas sp. ATA003]WNB85195.1 FkbM family methyltransferase [Cellulomonas sp. ATA003]